MMFEEILQISFTNFIVLQIFIVSVCSGNNEDVLCDEEEKKSFPTVKERSCEVPIELRTSQEEKHQFCGLIIKMDP